MSTAENYGYFTTVIHNTPSEATHYAVLQYDFTEVYLKNNECSLLDHHWKVDEVVSVCKQKHTFI